MLSLRCHVGSTARRQLYLCSRIQSLVRSGFCSADVVKKECYMVDPASSHMLVSKIKPCMWMHLLDKRSTRAMPVVLMIHDNSTDCTAFSSRPFCWRCAPGLNWPIHASGTATLKKLECSKQAYALDTLAWDNIIGFRSYYVGLRDRRAQRRSDTVLVSTISDADQGLADVTFWTPLAPYEKSKFLGSGGSMIIAIVGLQRGIPSKRESSARVDYVPALCTHRPSLLPIEWSGEVFGSW
ncbi:hypothetical protein LOK49_LG12G03019 [Camellia lanceoleosa]|uniref:Uncharacterized protein n=1 Tax=Camellia lanceoleosa TaxID=1840588 RepID=A0ACC0FQT4_9ERIC|nr:hypothetical protein LOK49_LG12G03019 [Camellia lanceoleosa]